MYLVCWREGESNEQEEVVAEGRGRGVGVATVMNTGGGRSRIEMVAQGAEEGDLCGEYETLH